ncbi:MAG TPA: hypothetical protein VFA26_12420 [Gemmataceae bacterium]|nr:hypothetical protein [Gemmataceae bacterium]
MRMLPLIAGFVCLALAAVATAADDKAEAKGKPVDYEVYTSYFQKNNSGLKGDQSFVAITTQEGFDKIFGPARVMKPQKFLPTDAFAKKMVAATIKRGKAITTYKVDKVTSDGGTLYVQYEAMAKGGGGTATYASPLIVAVDKGKYAEVVFIENGKKVGTAKVGK